MGQWMLQLPGDRGDLDTSLAMRHGDSFLELIGGAKRRIQLFRFLSRHLQGLSIVN